MVASVSAPEALMILIEQLRADQTSSAGRHLERDRRGDQAASLGKARPKAAPCRASAGHREMDARSRLIRFPA